MSSDEFSANEQEIMAQIKTIGLPNKQDVQKQSSSYTNSKDGKWVTINGNHVFIEKD